MLKRRGFAAILCLVLCLVAFPVPQAMAATPGTGGSEIMPLMEYIFDADADFTISNGTALMFAFVDGDLESATKSEVTVELQRQGLLFWDTIATWTSTENGSRAEVDVSYEVDAGKTYRMVTSVTVWSGTKSETQNLDPIVRRT